MRISELLNAIASWLESSENEALLLSEDNDECLSVVANGCVMAANILKKTAEEADRLEPGEESKLTLESLDGLNDILTAFDRSGNKDLEKTANLIDELLLTFAAPPNWYKNHKEDKQLEKAHLHDLIGTVAHIHRENATWRDLFKNIGYSVSSKKGEAGQ